MLLVDAPAFLEGLPKHEEGGKVAPDLVSCALVMGDSSKK